MDLQGMELVCLPRYRFKIVFFETQIANAPKFRTVIGFPRSTRAEISQLISSMCQHLSTSSLALFTLVAVLASASY